MGRTLPRKRVSVRDAWRFVGMRVVALHRMVEPGDGPITEEERDAIENGLKALTKPSTRGTLFDNLIALWTYRRFEAPTTKGDRRQLVLRGAHVTVHAEAAEELPAGARPARLVRGAHKARLARPRGGQPSQHGAREALRVVVAIIDHNATDHAPKVTALLLWLLGCELREQREPQSPADYIARNTRRVAKLTRAR